MKTAFYLIFTAVLLYAWLIILTAMPPQHGFNAAPPRIIGTGSSDSAADDGGGESDLPSKLQKMPVIGTITFNSTASALPTPTVTVSIDGAPFQTVTFLHAYNVKVEYIYKVVYPNFTFSSAGLVSSDVFSTFSIPSSNRKISTSSNRFVSSDISFTGITSNPTDSQFTFITTNNSFFSPNFNNTISWSLTPQHYTNFANATAGQTIGLNNYMSDAQIQIKNTTGLACVVNNFEYRCKVILTP